MSFFQRFRDVLRPGLNVWLLAIGSLLAAASPSTAALSQNDMASISTAVSSALAAAASGGPSAMTEALKTVTGTMMGQYGGANAQDVAAIIIADALSDGATPDQVGQAMGQEALALGAPGANSIADAIGGSGDSDVLVSFDAAVSGSPGGEQLAAEADGYARLHKGHRFGDITIGGGVFGAGGVNGGVPFCVKTSCS